MTRFELAQRIAVELDHTCVEPDGTFLECRVYNDPPRVRVSVRPPLEGVESSRFVVQEFTVVVNGGDDE